MTETAIVWFRRDLRLADNAALSDALQRSGALIPVFIPPPALGTGEASWLSHSLPALGAALEERGSRVIIRTGPPAEALVALTRECGARSAHCARVWTPSGMVEERDVARALYAVGVTLSVTEGSLLVTPDGIASAAGGPYRVFTPYFTAWQRAWHASEPAPAPDRIPAPETPLASELLPTPRTGGPDPTGWWTPGESGALRRLTDFVSNALERYDEVRDLPADDETSHLSPHIAFGEVSPRQIVAAVTRSTVPALVTKAFVRQLAWREFAAHVLHHNPHTLTEPLRPEFAAMPWRDDSEDLERWRAGVTGYPLVDAGMRQLSATGWMHNRVRLVAASLLTKHLLVQWQTGERVFADALIDFDIASNVFNWQWVAGCGADAAPYYRIFNPTMQVKRFDAGGEYIRRWVPELAGVPSRWIAEPWNAPRAEARAAGVSIGTDYPVPVIDHREARSRALAAYAAMRS